MSKNPMKTNHPRLYRRCLELVGQNEETAAILCLLVVLTAPNKGLGGVVLEGEAISLPPHIVALRLHELVGRPQ